MTLPQFVTLVSALITLTKRARQMQKALNVVKALFSLPPFLREIAEGVAAALEDGDLSADEAEQLARELAAEADLKLKIKGVDVIDDDAQADLAAFVARVVRNAVAAA